MVIVCNKYNELYQNDTLVSKTISAKEHAHKIHPFRLWGYTDQYFDAYMRIYVCACVCEYVCMRVCVSMCVCVWVCVI